ncbi:flavin reductase [Microbacterium sp. Kw_RZR3]|jgi:flavin reductase (NADH)|uniref:flavin reductase n=1 Tax=unclassified Microbacterium TaxID=2609290 RepID=UPI0023DCD5E2|nr:flavin reductase [Microbacterium sp. Kw_RZR3]MDF2045799.1 flavin reductase [Microbacterium sp. Kw_RZR3]MDF2918148.1 4-hydroxyphenylacetate 3-monooxygenase, reductase component [Microbacterium sp.]
MNNELSPQQVDFRHAMANLAAAVHIVTSDGPHGRVGITVSAACSVTDSPPTVLVCINRSSATRNVFARNGRLALNILAADQEELARHFSGQTGVPMPERFAWDIWTDLEGVPTLTQARAALSGRVVSLLEQGTHTIFFVEIDAIRNREDVQALVYDRRAFHAVGAVA